MPKPHNFIVPAGVAVVGSEHGDHFTITQEDPNTGTIYVSAPLPYNANLRELRRATGHMPISFIRPGPWWARVIGWLLDINIFRGRRA